MNAADGRPPLPTLALLAFLVYFVVQRLGELWISTRNARRMFARGAREHGREHYPMLIALHTLFPAALIGEVLWLGARPGPLTPCWVVLWVLAQGLRWASMESLGECWNTRIIVLPGAPLVRRGPYRWLRHPNYVAVAVELLSASLMFGAWRTAVVLSIANAIALRVRIASENRALGLSS